METWDALVVGAGPAGLTAAIYLARFRRRVLVLHDGEPRAAWIPKTRNLPGWPDGIAGEGLLQLMTEQALRYGAELRSQRVDDVRYASGRFEIDGAAAPMLLLATGVEDNEPPLPGVEQAVKRGLIRICPICDGFEVTGKDIGVLACGDKGAREAAFLKTYTDRVTLIHTGAPEDLSDESRRYLTLMEVGLIETPAESVTVEADQVLAFGWGGEVRRFDSIYSALGVTPRCGIAVSLGAELAEDGRLVVGDHQRTSVPGLYAAGDVVRGLNQLTVAMAEAALAAVHIHNSLREAEGLVAP